MTAKQGHASHPRRIRIRLTRLLAGSLAAASTTPHLPAPPPRSSARRSSVLVRCCRCWQASPVRPGGGAGTTLRGERGQAHGCHLLSPNRCPLSASSPRRTHLPLTLKHTLSSAKSKKENYPHRAVLCRLVSCLARLSLMHMQFFSRFLNFAPHYNLNYNGHAVCRRHAGA